MATNETNKMFIQTLGKFSVSRGELILSAGSGKSQKMWELFKYFITFRQKNVLVDEILETLWPDQDYEDSNKAFRTMVFRLRQALKRGLPPNNQVRHIIFEHGCYSWSGQEDYSLDAEEFEKCYTALRRLQAADRLKNREVYEKIIEIYQGSYLPESLYTEWTIPVRNHYRRLYLQAMTDYCELLSSEGMNRQLIEVCEKVIRIEPLEEDFHVRFMQALVKEGKFKDARQNYEYITAKMYQEFGIRPSPEMRGVYSRITAGDKTGRAGIEEVQEKMAGSPGMEGPFYCDRKTFESIYDLERRRTERNGQSVFIVLFTLQPSDRLQIVPGEAENAFAVFREIINRSLRKGDVYTDWDELQLVLILPGTNMEQTKLVIERLEKAFREKTKQEDILIKSRYQPILQNLYITRN